MPSTISLQYIVDVVRTSKGMKPLVNVGQVPNEPALTLCNNVLQRILAAPYNWRFNKFAFPPFTTIAYQQDYVISGCTAACKGRYILSANAVNSANGPGLTNTSGNTVTLTFSDFAPNGFQAGGGPNVGDNIVVAGALNPGYNGPQVVSATPTTQSLQYIITGSSLPADGGQGFSNPGINWMEHVSLTDFQSSATVVPTHDAEIAASLFMESIIQPPIKFAFQVENIITTGPPGPLQVQTVIPMIRAWPVPSSQVWGVYMFYQGKAPYKTDLGQTWTPFPDDLSYVLVSNLKALALDWWEDPRAVNSLLLADRDILKALSSKDQEPRSEAFFPDLPISRGG